MNLYRRYPNFSEGDLSKARAALVSEDALVEIAIKLNLGSYLLLGPGEEKSGGRMRPSILGDCVEALVGAMALDSSYTQVEYVVEKLFSEYLNYAEQLINKDSRSVLQELLQKSKIKVPIYKFIGTDGPAHRAVFHIECEIPELDIKVIAQGRTKKEAYQVAAERALALIKSSNQI